LRFYHRCFDPIQITILTTQLTASLYAGGHPRLSRPFSPAKFFRHFSPAIFSAKFSRCFSPAIFSRPFSLAKFSRRFSPHLPTYSHVLGTSPPTQHHQQHFSPPTAPHNPLKSVAVEMTPRRRSNTGFLDVRLRPSTARSRRCLCRSI
jgi:hypothetical protein